MNSNDLEMMGKDLSKLETLIKQLEATRKKEIEKQEELAKEQETTAVEELSDKVENIWDNRQENTDINVDTIEKNNLENTANILTNEVSNTSVVR